MSVQSVIQVETLQVDDSGNRQISSRLKMSELLANRRADIEAAVAQAVDVVQTSMDDAPERNGWKISKLEAAFGIKLKADAGAVLARAGGEASFDIKITIERK